MGFDAEQEHTVAVDIDVCNPNRRLPTLVADLQLLAPRLEVPNLVDAMGYTGDAPIVLDPNEEIAALGVRECDDCLSNISSDLSYVSRRAAVWSVVESRFELDIIRFLARAQRTNDGEVVGGRRAHRTAQASAQPKIEQAERAHPRRLARRHD
jgi:hypothetical protein